MKKKYHAMSNINLTFNGTCPLFLTYQAFKGREGTFSQTNLAEGFKIGHLWVETNKNMKDL